jgi:hypothetical protein
MTTGLLILAGLSIATVTVAIAAGATVHHLIREHQTRTVNRRLNTDHRRPDPDEQDRTR